MVPADGDGDGAGGGVEERRTKVRVELASGDVASLRDLAGRLHDDGMVVTPEALRGDVRALGAIRVQHGDSTVLALPVDDPSSSAGRSGGAAPSLLAAEVSADPDWPVHVGVVVVVAVFLLVALAGWLISV